MPFRGFVLTDSASSDVRSTLVLPEHQPRQSGEPAGPTGPEDPACVAGRWSFVAWPVAAERLRGASGFAWPGPVNSFRGRPTIDLARLSSSNIAPSTVGYAWQSMSP